MRRLALWCVFGFISCAGVWDATRASETLSAASVAFASVMRLGRSFVEWHRTALERVAPEPSIMFPILEASGRAKIGKVEEARLSRELLSESRGYASEASRKVDEALQRRWGGRPEDLNVSPEGQKRESDVKYDMTTQSRSISDSRTNGPPPRIELRSRFRDYDISFKQIRMLNNKSKRMNSKINEGGFEPARVVGNDRTYLRVGPPPSPEEFAKRRKQPVYFLVRHCDPNRDRDIPEGREVCVQ